MLKHNRNNSEQCGQTLVEESSVTEPGDTQPPVIKDASSELSMTSYQPNGACLQMWSLL